MVGGVALALGLAAALFGLLHSPAYVAEATIVVRPEEGIGANAELEGLSQRTRDVVDTPRLRREAAWRAEWTSGLRGFNERLDVQPDENTTGEIRVSFSGATAAEARDAANAYVRTFVEAPELGEQKFAGGTLGADAQVLRDATLSRWRSLGPLLYGILACIIGVLLGGAVALLLEGRTRQWRGAKDAELTLRAPVLGVIPDHTLEHRSEEQRIG